jgi:CRP/FNR family transcriptional regulator, anaerobic regulatory protein
MADSSTATPGAVTTADIASRLRALYPHLAALSEAGLRELLRLAQLREAPAGTVMFDESQRCEAFPLLLEGSIRVSKIGSNGREIQLYRVLPGEACVLTSSCLLGNAAYRARGVAESPLTLLALPAGLFMQLLAAESGFRDYVFGLFSERISDLIQLVEAVAFQRLDRRLAQLLLGKGKVLHVTHQQLAEELGSVREIVSRLLGSFADQGLVSLGREQIEVLDARRLRELADA